MKLITAEVITCPGRWEDATFQALEISIEGVSSPFHMTMALSKVSVKALAEQVDPDELYAALAAGINASMTRVSVRP